MYLFVPTNASSFTPRAGQLQKRSTCAPVASQPERTPTVCLAARKPWPAGRFFQNFLFYTPLGRLLRGGAGPSARTPASQMTARHGRRGSPILVTGASGGTGCRVVRDLLAEKRHVIALTRSREKLEKVLESVGVQTAAVESEGLLTVVVSDLYNLPEDVLFNVSAVLNCTGVKTGPVDDDIDRSKYYQGIVQYPPAILEDTPKNVEYNGVSRLAKLAEREFSQMAGKRASENLFDFSDTKQTKITWGSLDDVVMGGVSESGARTEKGNLVFSGVTRTENSGGFASVRTANFSQPLDLGQYDGVQLRVRGDGQRYKFIIRTDRAWDGISYCKSFTTKEDEWMVVNAPFADFVPTRRGKTVSGAPELTGDGVSAIQVMLSKFEYDGDLNGAFRPGAFRLTINSIRAFREASGRDASRPRLVQLSSAAVTRPLRMGEIEGTASHVPIVKLNEQIGRLLDWKLAGEDAIRTSGVDYTIVRATALTMEEATGMRALTFSQGDLLTGRVTRDDAARLLIDVLDVDSLRGVTFEVATAEDGLQDGMSVAQRSRGLAKDDAKREFGPFPYVPDEVESRAYSQSA